MARKYVRFNYFEVKLVSAKEVIMKEQNNKDDRNYSSAELWDMRGFLDYLASKKELFETNIKIGDEQAEFEHDSHIFNEKFKTYGFQLSKLRETNVPAKKKINRIKEEIMLEDDEFIGEFNSILYDSQYHVLMIQSNLYGLSIPQIEQYLTELRLKYLDEIGKNEDEILMVRISPILDPTKLKSAFDAEYYRRIRVKGSDYSLDAALDDTSLISDARRTLGKMKGVNIEVIVTVGQADRTSTLDSDEVRSVLKSFEKLDESRKPVLELSVKEDYESPVEVINLIEPRMTDRLSIEVEPRKSIAHEYLFQVMLDKYKERKSDVRRVLSIV